MDPNPFLDIGLGDLLPFVGLIGLLLVIRRDNNAAQAAREKEAKAVQKVREDEIRNVTEWRTKLEGRVVALEGRRDEDRAHHDKAHESIGRRLDSLATKMSEGFKGVYQHIDTVMNR